MPEATQFTQIVETFLQVNNLLTQIQKRPVQITKDLRLSTSMIHLIDLVGNHPQLSISALATRLGVTKGAVSQQVPTLIARGLVQVNYPAGNHKTKLISLTKAGHQVYQAHNSLHASLYQAIQTALATFSPAQVTTLQHLLEQVATTIQNGKPQPGKD